MFMKKQNNDLAFWEAETKKFFHRLDTAPKQTGFTDAQRGIIAKMLCPTGGQKLNYTRAVLVSTLRDIYQRKASFLP